MKAKGVIRQAVDWEHSRAYFYWRAKRRMLEDDFVSQMMNASSDLSKADAVEVVKSMFGGDYEDDKALAEFMESNASDFADKVKSTRAAGVQAQIEALKAELESL